MITTQIDQLVDRITQTDASAVVAAYERRIRGLEEEKLAIEDRIAAAEGAKPRSFEETLRTAVEFLLNPCRLWRSGSIQNKRLVAKLVFAGRVAYSRSEGFRTPDFSLPFKWLGSTTDALLEMASPTGNSSNQVLEVLQEWNVLLTRTGSCGRMAQADPELTKIANPTTIAT